MSDVITCPACQSTDMRPLSEIPEMVPPLRRNDVPTKVLYIIVLLFSWVIVLATAFMLVTFSFLRHHLEVSWLEGVSDFRIVAPIILVAFISIIVARILWVRCTDKIAAETVWNRDEFPRLLGQWRASRRCRACGIEIRPEKSPYT